MKISASAGLIHTSPAVNLIQAHSSSGEGQSFSWGVLVKPQVAEKRQQSEHVFVIYENPPTQRRCRPQRVSFHCG